MSSSGRGWSFIVCVALSMLSACSTATDCMSVDFDQSLGSVRQDGLKNRCADMMRLAFAGGGVSIENQTISLQKDGGFLVQGTGTTDRFVPDQPLSWECSFDQNAMTDFDWIKGPTR